MEWGIGVVGLGVGYLLGLGHAWRLWVGARQVALGEARESADRW